jgi:hypothetical protein
MKPSAGLEPATPSLPWKRIRWRECLICSTFRGRAAWQRSAHFAGVWRGRVSAVFHCSTEAMTAIGVVRGPSSVREQTWAWRAPAPRRACWGSWTACLLHGLLPASPRRPFELPSHDGRPLLAAPHSKHRRHLSSPVDAARVGLTGRSRLRGEEESRPEHLLVVRSVVYSSATTRSFQGESSSASALCPAKPAVPSRVDRSSQRVAAAFCTDA